MSAKMAPPAMRWKETIRVLVSQEMQGRTAIEVNQTFCFHILINVCGRGVNLLAKPA